MDEAWVAELNRVCELVERALEENDTLQAAAVQVEAERGDASDVLVTIAWHGALGGDIIVHTILPEPGTLRAKFWHELAPREALIDGE